ncbi:MAG: xanthine phosphoribosyltransferase [Eubacterium sp.]|nr:xanthine phosphoribosyltransferase [Eubacterium sp.]
MKELEERILKDGSVRPGDIIKVDNFLNHQIDIALIDRMAKEWKKLFADKEINKILTVEASGIALAAVTALEFSVPMVFAKKSATTNIDKEVYSAKVYSYTHQNEYNLIVSKKYLGPEDKVLIIDDVLANGKALEGLIAVVQSAGASVSGVGIAIEKGYMPGGKIVRDMGIQVESLAIIAHMDDQTGKIEFA